MVRAESDDADTLAELLVSAARPLAPATLRTRLGWSRQRHAKAQRVLQALGATLVASGNDVLLRLADPLDASAIRDSLPRSFAFDEIIVRRVCSSTNDCVRGQASTVLCVAEVQTAGRGRRGKVWMQPFGSGLALSLGAPAPRGRLDPLAIAVATAAAMALEDAGYRGIGLKWPNDLYACGRKLGGVLVEVEGGFEPRVVIGLGLNVHGAPALADRDTVALGELSGPQPCRNVLAAGLAAALAHALERFEAEGFAPFAREFATLDVLVGQTITLSEGDTALRGVARGIDEMGALVLDTDSGCLHRTAGEVTLGAWAGA
ncbi:MAG TPA: biotin--[acetyl-CoA-carboxylase] ligase [Gammaproteobacteria bacterium]|nr:biotin--[acetyl-CoA-carboxylase] ligase [Gammaproteobacteria bacterium]